MKHWIVSLLLCFSPLSLAQLAIGDSFPALDITSQHNKSLHLDERASHVLFANTKPASTLMTNFLEARGDAWLADNQAYYLADIHKMPKVISRMVAMPKMRKLGYDIYLGREADTFAMLPSKEGCVTHMSMTNLRITAIEFLCTLSELDAVAKPQ